MQGALLKSNTNSILETKNLIETQTYMNIMTDMLNISEKMETNVVKTITDTTKQ